MMEQMMQYLPLAVALIGVLAFLVSLITQVIKSIPALAGFPPQLMVLILSLLVTVVALLAYAEAVGLILTWWMIVAAIIASFVVAFLAMFGWEKLRELWQEFGSGIDDLK